MDKRIISRIQPLFEGIVSRMCENSDYFICIEFELKSGNKMFPAQIIADGEKYIFSCGAVKRSAAAEKLWDTVSEELKNYDEAIIFYKERGAVIVIEADRRGVRMKHTDASSAASAKPDIAAVQSKRDYIVNPSVAAPLLRELGILGGNGKIKNDKIRKYNQVDYFVELMSGVIGEINKGKELLIMDCACGKSYLSFVLNFYLRDILKLKCRFVGIDRSEGVIEASARMAKNLGYNNMEFISEDLTTYTPPEKPDVVISLHACDIATDMAIGLGIRAGAKAIVSVPCCHKDILKQYSYEPFSAVTKHGILKARLADTLTDALRAAYLEGKGYKVSLIEYISPLETPKNIMIRAIRKGSDNADAMSEYSALKRLIGVNPAIERFSGEKRKYERIEYC